MSKYKVVQPDESIYFEIEDKKGEVIFWFEDQKFAKQVCMLLNTNLELKKQKTTLGMKYVGTLHLISQLVNFDHYSSDEAKEHFINIIQDFYKVAEDDIHEFRMFHNYEDDVFNHTQFIEKILEDKNV